MRTLMSMAAQMRRRQSVRPAGSLKSVSHKRTASGNENSCAPSALHGDRETRTYALMLDACGTVVSAAADAQDTCTWVKAGGLPESAGE